MVRELTSLGIRLIFEKENIDTETMESEFLLTLLAAFAESESQSISSNQKWSIRRRFQAGTYKGGKVPYGYRRTKKATSSILRKLPRYAGFFMRWLTARAL